MDLDEMARRVNGAQSRRSIAQLLGGGALAAAVSWLSLPAGRVTAGRKKKQARKKPVCLCTATACTSKKVRNRTKVIGQNPQCNYAGACAANPCAARTCASSAECTGGQVCVGGQCVDCTSYTQCETTTTAGHLACLGGAAGGMNSAAPARNA